ncbi:MAG: dienelactone hydrolase family protein [Archangium sp.]
MKTTLLAALLATSASAAVVQKKVAYDLDGAKYESVLVFDDANKDKKPGVLLVPNWLGINEANLKQAELVASRGYVVFVADVFGLTGRPADMAAAGKVSGALKDNRPLLRKRVTKAFDVFRAQKNLPVADKQYAAIGFCFGGTTALELARTGAPLAAVVSFHGGLGSPTPADAKNIKGKVLALHGADDPYVPADEVTAFQKEMRDAKTDWELVSFGNTVHSFTDVDAKQAGQAEYNPTSAKRAYALMDALFAEVFVR